jgi:hypothetical protein
MNEISDEDPKEKNVGLVANTEKGTGEKKHPIEVEHEEKNLKYIKSTVY